ncbi:DNA-processing protein DprA [Fredinandcohnia quinoae]|uniref:DNA-processing protein DprA n=1 Tax=Fredinandcohnia quinoae TaxID=2918902 RepID=A0AAW5E6J6_9BACI|nr:DNA-processing protein DprA [Fredinandcohnia sp. SECRCQ15]MCH1625596.1 DNA-processing protein DprA [Fredinandcohnia sp. SECRCQ15]
MDLVYWVWLSTCKYVGPISQKQLINHFHSPYAVFEANEAELLAVPGINKRAASSILRNRSLENAEQIVSTAIKKNINILHYNDPLYLPSSREYRESPIVLYYKGKLKSFDKAVAVVGSRRCSPYGKKVAAEIGKKLAEYDIPIVSGFAKGIDSYTHEACLKKRGYPIAFLASGVDICYPKEQLILYKKIVEMGGVFLSQYPPGTPPTPKLFLQRNALISAWSTEVIIVEAGENSGALWTADFAKKHGKTIYAVPNQIDRAEGYGTNLLLSEGVKPLLNIDNLNVIKERTHDKSQFLENSHEHQNSILTYISESPHTLSSLSHLTKLSEENLLDKLFELELNGSILIRGNVVSKR